MKTARFFSLGPFPSFPPMPEIPPIPPMPEWSTVVNKPVDRLVSIGDVYVNPATVTALQATDEATTEVHLESGQTVLAPTPLATVVKHLGDYHGLYVFEAFAVDFHAIEAVASSEDSKATVFTFSSGAKLTVDEPLKEVMSKLKQQLDAAKKK